MQIDLANILVHKVYFVYHALFIISPQARSSPPLGGVGGGYWGGRTTYLYLVKIKIHLMINSLVCVPSPLKKKAHPQPLPREGRRELAG